LFGSEVLKAVATVRYCTFFKLNHAEMQLQRG